MRKRRMLSGLLSLVMALSLFNGIGWKASAATPTVTVAPEITYATDASAFLKEIELSQTGAWNVTVKAHPTASGQTFAVLLRYDLFNANHNTDGSIGGINAGTYNSVAVGTSNPNYYRYQNATAVNGTDLTIFSQTLYNFNSGNTGYQVTETSTTYHMRYALIIFDGGTNLENLSDYTIVTFYINSQGWLQTESYMLRYQTNAYPTGTTTVGSMPAYQIEGWGTDASVNGATKPTRTGYTFLGWDANSRLMNADANTAAAQVVTPEYPAGNTGPVPWATASAAFGTTTFNKSSDKFYDLYAVWRPNKVEFDLADAPNEASVNGVNIHVLTLPSPQVGVAYSATISLGLAPKYTTDSGTTKGYSWPTEYIGKAISFAGDEPGTTVNLTTAHQLSVATASNTSWRISGTPTAHSDGAPVYAVLQVKDNGNNTTDLIVLRFEEVKKGAQPIPTLDDNTGLQSRVVTSTNDEGEEVTDGQIYGFYSAGPVKDTDGMTTGYWTGKTDGTGTMTNYYITNRMIYEYRPVRVDGEAVDYTDTELPNDGWREMPMPSNWYTNSAINPVRTALENSLKKNATAVIKTGYAPTNNSYAPVTEVTTGLTASFLENGWPDSYGWIEYDGTLPILHGLTEDDQYEVRFRANDAYEVSKSQIITIGGAVADTEPSGSSGLAVNLAGGEWKDADAAAAEAFVKAAAALTVGGTLNLPEIEPVREGGYTFAGWTLGERDSDGRLILYRLGTAVTPPEEPEEPENPESVTVKWIDGTDDSEITHTVTSVPKGSEVSEEDYPSAPEHSGKAFDKWVVTVDEETGNITITAMYTDKPEITYIWEDPLKEGEDKTVGTAVTGTDEPTAEQYPADPVHEGEAPFKGWVIGEPVEVPVEGAEDGATRLQVTITATYKEKVTYIWLDPLKEEDDKTVQTAEDVYDMPDHPAAPDHGEEHPFVEWSEGEPKTDGEGVTTITITAVYKEKVRYIWLDPLAEAGEGEEANQTIAVKELFDKPEETEYPAAPGHAGVTFRGWKEGEPETDEAGKVTVTYTAEYGEPVTYVWIDPRAEEESRVLKTLADAFDKPEEGEYPTAPDYEGWTFSGWQESEPETDEETGVVTVTYTAVYEMEKWTFREELPAIGEFPASLAAVWDGGSGGGGLAVNLAGGTISEEESAAYEAFVAECHALTAGQSVTIPDITPIKQYYEFAGWTLGEFGEDGALITFQAGDRVTLGNEPSALTVVWNATTEAFFPIVFYDWDGVTMLGTKIVPIVADVATQERLIDDAMREFAELQMSVANAEAYRADGYDPALGTDEAFYNANKPLSNKKGYTFGKWIDFDAVDENGNEVYTNYGAVVMVQNATRMADDLPEPAGHVFTEADLTNGITVKAAFCSNATLAPQKDYTGTETALWNYTVSVESDLDDYLQFGGTTNYGITVTVKRENEGVGVARVRNMGLRIGLSISGSSQTVYVLQRLDNQDEVTSTIALNGAVTSALVEVVDLCDVLTLGGTANWANGAVARSNSLTLTPDGADGFVQLSGVGFFNDMCRTSIAMGLTGDDWINNTAAFTASGLTAAAAANYTAAGLVASTSASARRQNVGKILNAYIAKGGALTHDEMQAAIDGA